MRKKIFIAIILITATLWSLEKMYDFFLSNNLYIKHSYVKKKQVDADILILGNCIPETTLNPIDIEKTTNLKTYNLAQDHSNITENYLSFHIYLKYNKAPKIIVLYLSPEIFDKSLNKFNTFRFANYLEDTIISNTLKYADPNYLKWKNVPFLKYGFYNNHIHFNALQGAIHYFSNRKKILSENGYLEANGTDLFKPTYSMGYKFKWDYNQESYLIKINELAIKSHSKLIFYESPMFIRKPSDQPNRQKIVRKIEKLAIKLKRPYFKSKKKNLSKSNFRTNVKLKGKEKTNFNRELGGYIKNHYPIL